MTSTDGKLGAYTLDPLAKNSDDKQRIKKAQKEAKLLKDEKKNSCFTDIKKSVLKYGVRVQQKLFIFTDNFVLN